jgi:hypothetical protein
MVQGVPFQALRSDLSYGVRFRGALGGQRPVSRRKDYTHTDQHTANADGTLDDPCDHDKRCLWQRVRIPDWPGFAAGINILGAPVFTGSGPGRDPECGQFRAGHGRPRSRRIRLHLRNQSDLRHPFDPSFPTTPVGIRCLSTMSRRRSMGWCIGRGRWFGPGATCQQRLAAEHAILNFLKFLPAPISSIATPRYARFPTPGLSAGDALESRHRGRDVDGLRHQVGDVDTSGNASGITARLDGYLRHREFGWSAVAGRRST